MDSSGKAQACGSNVNFCPTTYECRGNVCCPKMRTMIFFHEAKIIQILCFQKLYVRNHQHQELVQALLADTVTTQLQETVNFFITLAVVATTIISTPIIRVWITAKTLNV